MYSDEMDRTIRMTTFNNVKYRHIHYLKFGDRFFPSLAILGLQTKASIFCTIRKIYLYSVCRTFLAFIMYVIINIF